VLLEPLAHVPAHGNDGRVARPLEVVHGVRDDFGGVPATAMCRWGEGSRERDGRTVPGVVEHREQFVVVTEHVADTVGFFAEVLGHAIRIGLAEPQFRALHRAGALHGNTGDRASAAFGMKRIGFLSFGHYQDVPGSLVHTAQDSLLQTVELVVAAEEVGVDGAYVRVHHFAPQFASPFPLLAAMAARTSRIELGTGVIDMRYENPLYMAEEAAITDLISNGRLQLGISRGSPETALRGYESFGYAPAHGETDADEARSPGDCANASGGAQARERRPTGRPSRA
jgi:hypothetical protein